MITKEICDANKCPLVPPNCPQFMMVEGGGDPRLIFSCFEHSCDPKTWSHDSDFPWFVCNAKKYMRPIIAAVAFAKWDEIIGAAEDDKGVSLNEFKMYVNASVEWKKWALADPDEDEDEDDDSDLPIVFKEPQK